MKVAVCKIWLLGMIFLARLAMGQPAVPVVENHALMILVAPDLIESQNAKKNAWSGVCDEFSRDLLKTKRTFSGFLNSARCIQSEDAESEGDRHPAKFNWHIVFRDQGRFFTVDVYFVHNKKRYRESSISFARKDSLSSYLKSDEFRTLLSQYLMDALPTGRAFFYRGKNRFRIRSDGFKLSEKGYIYELFFRPQKGLWFSRVVAQVTKLKTSHGSKKTKVEAFSIEELNTTLKPGTFYWYHSVQGRNAQKDHLENLMQQLPLGFTLLDFVDRLLFESLESNYSGVRYGVPLFLQTDTVLAKAKVISLFTEIRSGLLEGFRWHYDITPQVTSSKSGVDEKLKWARASLGWAFVFPMPEPISSYVTHLDVVPNVGLMDFSSDLAVTNPSTNQVEVFNFEAKNIYDVGLELGAEYENAWARLRLWGETNFAGLQRNEGGVTVNSLQVGLDSYYELMRFNGGLRINILGYVAFERFAVDKAAVSSSGANNDIKGLSFNFAQTGLGLTL
jgi:hypothetical protein